MLIADLSQQQAGNMPDMLVLRRDLKTGGMAMHVEIDTTPPLRPSWESRRLPEPIRTAVCDKGADIEDVEWLQDAVVDLIEDYDWDPEELVHVKWNDLYADLAELACR